jgi:ATP-dependent exoDNAse (exonuclease V) beta subunit
MLVPETTDFRALGAAIHAVFAYRLQHGGGAGDAPPAPDDGLRDRRDRDDSNPEPPWVRPEADSHVDPVAMQKAAEALRRVIQETWTVRRMRTEVPVMQKAHGRLTSGVADLVVETGDGLVLIDHKVMQGSSDEAIRKAGEYAQQLRAYADILEAAERRPVQSMWIHLPVQGKLVEIRS